MSQALLLVNFGGPRCLEEVSPFLVALLTDQDVLQTGLPPWVHRLIFTRVARRRSRRICEEYREMGGGSPLFKDTEVIAEALQRKGISTVLTFQRYLPATHANAIEAMIKAGEEVDEIIVVPLFPQFSYTTTGSCARWLAKHLPNTLVNKLRWVKSYGSDPRFVACWQAAIQEMLDRKGWSAQETVLLFSAHGIPKRYALAGDPYRIECLRSMEAIAAGFPKALAKLCFQSRFGPEEWLKPYAIDAVGTLHEEIKERRQCLMIPHAFTTDHLETLVEIENEYLPVLRSNGWKAERVSCLQNRQDFVDALWALTQAPEFCSTQMLIRNPIKLRAPSKKQQWRPPHDQPSYV